MLRKEYREQFFGKHLKPAVDLPFINQYRIYFEPAKKLWYIPTCAFVSNRFNAKQWLKTVYKGRFVHLDHMLIRYKPVGSYFEDA